MKIAEQLRGSSASSGFGDSTKPFFLWLIRDSQLKFNKSPKQEMLEKLDEPARNALHKNFAEYDCIPIPRPVEDHLLQKVEELQWQDLKAEFQEEYLVLERQIFASISSPFKLAGKTIDMQMFLSLAEKYSEALSGKKGVIKDLSNLPTQKQLVMRMRGEEAVKRGVEAYKQSFLLASPSFPLSSLLFTQTHLQSFEKANSAFREELCLEEGEEEGEEVVPFLSSLHSSLLSLSPSFSPSSSLRVGEGEEGREGGGEGEPKEALKVEILTGGLAKQFFEQNVEESNKRGEQLLKQVYSPILKKLEEASFSSLQQFYEEFKKAQQNYYSACSSFGINKHSLAKSFFSKSYQEHSIRVAHTLQANTSNQLQSLLLQLSTFSKQVDHLESKLSESKQILEQKLSDFKQLEELKSEALKTSLSHTSTTLSNQIESSIRSLKESFSISEKENLKKMETLEASISQISKDLDSRISSHQKLNHITSTLEEMIERHTKSESKLERTTQFLVQNEEKISLLSSNLEDLIEKEKKSLENNNFLSIKINQTESKLTRLEEENQKTNQKLTQMANSLSGEVLQKNEEKLELLRSELSKFSAKLENKQNLQQQTIDSFRSSIMNVEKLSSTQSVLIDEKLQNLSFKINEQINHNNNEILKKTTEASEGIDHVKESLEALWSSLASINAKMVDIESELDKNAQPASFRKNKK